jgi:hypothetical protein
VVVVIKANQIAKLQMTSQGRRLACNTLHSTTIAKDAKSVVCNDFEAWLIEYSGGVCLSNGKAKCIGETLPKRTRRHLNTRCVASFRMARSDAVDLAEMLQILYANLVSEQMEERILKHASVSIPATELA